MKSAARIVTATGMTQGRNPGASVPIPSTALSTDIAGVIMPSPYRSEAANKPAPASSTRPGTAPRLPSKSAVSAIAPPSPLLSARSTSPRYLIDTMIVSAQKTRERMPRTFAGVTATEKSPLKHSRMA